MKRELYLRVLLKNHLLPDIPCPNFSDLNVFFFAICKKNDPPNWKKTLELFLQNLLHCRYWCSIRKFAKQDLLIVSLMLSIHFIAALFKLQTGIQMFPARKNLSVLIAKISSRKTQKNRKSTKIKSCKILSHTKSFFFYLYSHMFFLDL